VEKGERLLFTQEKSEVRERERERERERDEISSSEFATDILAGYSFKDLKR